MDTIIAIFNAITSILTVIIGGGGTVYEGVAGALSSVIDASSTPAAE